jgi:hypothetical protein
VSSSSIDGSELDARLTSMLAASKQIWTRPGMTKDPAVTPVLRLLCTQGNECDSAHSW